MNNKKETPLIIGLQRGDKRAYSDLIELYSGRLYAYALSLIHDHALAQDIVQNVFFNIWKFRERIDTTRSIKNLLFKTTYNEFLNTYNRNQTAILIHAKYCESLSQIAREIDEDHLEDIKKQLNESIEKLPKKCKQIFLMSKKEGLTNIEIAEFLDVSVKAVEAQITKAFKLLKRELAQS